MAGLGRFPGTHEFANAASTTGCSSSDAASGAGSMPAAYVPPLLRLAGTASSSGSGIHQNASTGGLAWPSHKVWARVAIAATACVAGVALWQVWHHVCSQPDAKEEQQEEQQDAERGDMHTANNSTAFSPNFTQETRGSNYRGSGSPAHPAVNNQSTAQSRREHRGASPGSGGGRHAEQPSTRKRSKSRKRSRRRQRASAATSNSNNNPTSTNSSSSSRKDASSTVGGGGAVKDANKTAQGSSNSTSGDGQRHHCHHRRRRFRRRKSAREGQGAQSEQHSGQGPTQHSKERAGADQTASGRVDRGTSPSSNSSSASPSDTSRSNQASPRASCGARNRSSSRTTGTSPDTSTDASAQATRSTKRKSKLPSWAAAWLRRSESQPNMATAAASTAATAGASDTTRAGSNGATASLSSPSPGDEWPFWHWRKWRGGSVRARNGTSGSAGGGSRGACIGGGLGSNDDDDHDDEVLGLLQNSPLPSRQDLRSMLRAWASQGDLQAATAAASTATSTAATDGSSRSSGLGVGARDDASRRGPNDSGDSSRGATEDTSGAVDDTWGGLRLRSRSRSSEDAAARSDAGTANDNGDDAVDKGQPEAGGWLLHGGDAQASTAVNPDIITFDSDDNEEDNSGYNSDTTSDGIQPWMRMALHAQELAQQGDETTSSLFQEAAKLMLLFQQTPGDDLSPTPSSQMLLSMLGQGGEGELEPGSGTDSDDQATAPPRADSKVSAGPGLAAQRHWPGGDGEYHDDAHDSEDAAAYDEAQLQQMAASLLGNVQPMELNDPGGVDEGGAVVGDSGEGHRSDGGVGESRDVLGGRHHQQNPLSAIFDDAVQHEEIHED